MDLVLRLVTFHYRQSDPELPPITMNGHSLREAPCLEGLLELKVNPEPQVQLAYIRSIAKDAGKMVHRTASVNA